MPEFKTIAKVGDIPEGKGEAFEFEDQLVAVFNEGQGVYRAIDDMCPHMGASLAAGNFEAGIVTCPWHAWSFDTRDGTWCDNRRLKIDVFEVRVVGDEIQVAAIESESVDSEKGTALGGAGQASECDLSASANAQSSDEPQASNRGRESSANANPNPSSDSDTKSESEERH